MAVYEELPLEKLSLSNKIFHTSPKANFIAELQNILYKNESNIKGIKSEDIDKLKKKYKIHNKDFLSERKMLLDKYLVYCLTDKRLSDAEKDTLLYLSGLLWLPDDYLDNKIKEEGEYIYRTKMQCVISDNVVEKSEADELNTLKKEFNLADDKVINIYTDESQKKFRDFVNSLIDKRRMSPNEEKELLKMVENLHIDTKFIGSSDYNRIKLYWQLENATLPPIQSPINLQKNESLYYTTSISWYEERTRTVSTSYAGLTKSFRVCKGVSFRVGSVAPSRHSEEYLKLIDAGNVYLTSKRIIFTGEHSNKSIPYTKILDITPYRDGLEIGKDTGRKPFFECEPVQVDILGILIARFISNC